MEVSHTRSLTCLARLSFRSFKAASAARAFRMCSCTCLLIGSTASSCSLHPSQQACQDVGGLDADLPCMSTCRSDRHHFYTHGG